MSDTHRTLSIAAVQKGRDRENPGLAANFDLLADQARRAAASNPDLIVFPEYAISGWPYPPEDVINGIAESIPGDGPWFGRYRALAQELDTPILGWLVESSDGKRYNAGFILDRSGELVGKYRKVQANLGEQTWWGWSQGEAFEVIELDGVKYGISICADMWFPETVRCYELLGADVMIHMSIADDMGHIIPARAFDSALPIVCAIFNGGSYAVDARGSLISKLSATDTDCMIFYLHPFAVCTDKKYGGLWIPKKGHQNLRNIPAYAPLVDPGTRPAWTEVFLDDEGNPQTKAQLLERFNGRYDAHDPEG